MQEKMRNVKLLLLKVQLNKKNEEPNATRNMKNE